jgi:hypothetical protein
MLEMGLKYCKPQTFHSHKNLPLQFGFFTLEMDQAYYAELWEYIL